MDSADDNLTDHTVPRLRVTSQEARGAFVEPGHLSALLLQHGSMQLRWYAPNHFDPQVPHDRDEVYVVVAGSALFMRATEAAPFGEEQSVALYDCERVAVNAGDALFVPAGTQHRFEMISSDFGAWVIFYGPEGGETSVLPSLSPVPFLVD